MRIVTAVIRLLCGISIVAMTGIVYLNNEEAFSQEANRISLFGHQLVSSRIS